MQQATALIGSGHAGFAMFKPTSIWPTNGLSNPDRNEEFVAGIREQIGADQELMLDRWMAFDAEYTVRLAECLCPYGFKWMEEHLTSDEAWLCQVKVRLFADITDLLILGY